MPPSSPLRAAAASAGWPPNGQLDLFGSGSPVGTPDSSSASWIGNWSNPATPIPASRSQPQQDHAALSPVVLSQPGHTADAVAQWLQQNGGAPASERSDDSGAQAPRVGRMFDIPDIFLKFLRCNRVFTAEERGDLIEALCKHYQATKGFHHASALGELPLLQFLTTAARIEEELTGYIEQVFSLQLPRPMSLRGFELVRAICDIRYSDSEVCRQFLDPFQWVCTHWDEFHTLSFTGMLDRTSALFVFTVDAVSLGFVVSCLLALSTVFSFKHDCCCSCLSTVFSFEHDCCCSCLSTVFSFKHDCCCSCLSTVFSLDHLRSTAAWRRRSRGGTSSPSACRSLTSWASSARYPHCPPSLPPPSVSYARCRISPGSPRGSTTCARRLRCSRSSRSRPSPPSRTRCAPW